MVHRRRERLAQQVGREQHHVRRIREGLRGGEVADALPAKARRGHQVDEVKGGPRDVLAEHVHVHELEHCMLLDRRVRARELALALGDAGGKVRGLVLRVGADAFDHIVECLLEHGCKEFEQRTLVVSSASLQSPSANTTRSAEGVLIVALYLGPYIIYLTECHAPAQVVARAPAQVVARAAHARAHPGRTPSPQPHVPSLARPARAHAPTEFSAIRGFERQTGASQKSFLGFLPKLPRMGRRWGKISEARQSPAIGRTLADSHMSPRGLKVHKGRKGLRQEL